MASYPKAMPTGPSTVAKPLATSAVTPASPSKTVAGIAGHGPGAGSAGATATGSGTAPGLEECCPFQQAIDLLSKRHAMTIIWLLQQQSPRRFNDIRRSLDVNPVTLTQRLEELEQGGVVSRKAFKQIPPRVEYALTQKGIDLLPLMDQLSQWSQKHVPAPTPEAPSA